MSDHKLLGIGIGGAVIAAICCATPVLAVVLGMLGLSAWLAWSDYVVMPALLVFAALALYGWTRRQRARGGEACATRPAAKRS